jgi:hypothetical protein
MTFKATIREIDNGFLVELNLKPFEYDEAYASSFEGAIAAIVGRYEQWHPSVPPATPLRVPEKARKKPLLKEPSEAAVKYTKICGLVSKPLGEFQERFFKSFPGEDPRLAMVEAKCKVLEGKVVFVGGH